MVYRRLTRGQLPPRGGTPTPSPVQPIARDVPTAHERSGAYTYGEAFKSPPARRFMRGAFGARYDTPKTRGMEPLRGGRTDAGWWYTGGPWGAERFFKDPQKPIHTMTVPPPSGGLAGGGYAPPGQPQVEEPIPVTWESFDYRPPSAPDWWKAMKPSELNEQSEYLASVNMMIPFMSPEDRKTVAAQLYIADPENFAHLNPEKLLPPGIAPKVKPETRTERAFYMGAERSREAITALDRLREVMGKETTDFGPGYHFLRSVAATAGRYGGEGGPPGVPDLMTREKTRGMLGALDPILAMGRGEPISAYGPAAQAFGTPFFSGGQLWPMQRTEDGRYQFGMPNPRMFF